IFERAVRQRGLGRPATFSPGHPGAEGYKHIRRFAEELVSSARGFINELPPIHVDFVANGMVNAFAFKEEDCYFVGINTGTVFMLEFLFMRMLSDPRLFPNIGIPSEETAQPDLTKCIPSAGEMASAGYRSSHPKNRARHYYASLMFEQAMLFLVGHELA